MMPLAIIGVLLLAAIVGYGVYMFSRNDTLKNSKPRYKYVDTTDEKGIVTTKIVDLSEVDDK